MALEKLDSNILAGACIPLSELQMAVCLGKNRPFLSLHAFELLIRKVCGEVQCFHTDEPSNQQLSYLLSCPELSSSCYSLVL